MSEQTREGLEGLTINDLLLVLEQLPLNILEESGIAVAPTSSSAQDCCQLPDTPSSNASSNRLTDVSISSCDSEHRAAQKLGSKGGGVATAAQGRSDANISAVNQGMAGLEAFLSAVQMRGSMVSDPTTAKPYEQLFQSTDVVSSVRPEEHMTRECTPLPFPPPLASPAIDYNQGFVAISLGPSRPTLVLSLQAPTGLCAPLPQHHQPPPDPPPQPHVPLPPETQHDLPQTSRSESAEVRVSNSSNVSSTERPQENLASSQHPSAERQQENLASDQHPSSRPIASEVDLPLPDFGTIHVRNRHRRSASFSSIPYLTLSVSSPTALPARHMDWESASLGAKSAGDEKAEVELPVEVQEQCAAAQHAKNSLKFDASMSRRTRHKKEDLVGCDVKPLLTDNALPFGGGEKEDGRREEDMAQILERKKKELLETKPTLSWRFPKVEEYLKKEGGKEAGCPEPRGAKIQELIESLKAMPRLAASTIDPSPRQEPSPSKAPPPLEECSRSTLPSDAVATQESNQSESASLSSSSPSPPSSPSTPLPTPSTLPAPRIRQKPAAHCEVPETNGETRVDDASNGSQPGPKRFDHPAVLPLDSRDVAAGGPGRDLPVVPVVSRTEATMQGSAGVGEVEWAPTELQMAAMADMGSSRRSRTGGVSAIGESFARLLSQRNVSPLRRRKAKPETGREQGRAKSRSFKSNSLPRIDECGEVIDPSSLGVNKRLPGAGLGSTSKPATSDDSAMKEVLKSSVLNALVRDLHDGAARETSADTSSLGPPKAVMQGLPPTPVPPVEKGAVPALHGELQVPSCLSPNLKEGSSGPPPGPRRDERRDATPMPRRQVIREEIEEEVSVGRRQRRAGSTFLSSWGSKKSEQHGSGGSIKVSWSASPDRHVLVEPSEKERSGFGFQAALRGLKNRMMGSGSSSRTEHRGQQNFMRGSWPGRQSSSEHKFRGAPPVPLESGSEDSFVGGGGHKLKGSAYGHSWQGKGNVRHKASAGGYSFGNSTRDLKKPAKLNSPWEEALWKAWEDDQKGGEKEKKTVQGKETWEKALRSAWEEELSGMKPQTVSARSSASSRSFSLSGRRQSSRSIRHGRSPGRDSSEGSVADPWESLSDSVVPKLVKKHQEDDFPNVSGFHSISRKKSFLSVLWGRNQFDKEAMSQ